jgi:hypothetical protein
MNISKTGVSIAGCVEMNETRRWLSLESALVDEMRAGPSAELLARTAAVFMVARQFPRRHSSDRSRDFDLVVAPFQQCLSGLAAENLVPRVSQFAFDLGAMEGLVRRNPRSGEGIRPLSAASKFVWVAVPEIGIVYDRLARTYLGRLGHRVPIGDYGRFVAAFLSELPKHEDELSAVVKRLGTEAAAKPWMKRKIFDLWLYTNGKAALSD